MLRVRPCLPLVAALLGTSLAVAQPTESPQPLFDSDTALTMQFEGPFFALERQNPAAAEWFDAVIKFIDSDGAARSLDVQVQARSRSPAINDRCEFPTFWVRFDPTQTAGTIFEGQKQLAVISPCQDSRSTVDRYIYREYLAYKTYALLTPASFRVRPLIVDYVYTDKSSRLTDRAAFFLESESSVASRLGGTLVERAIVLPEFLDPAALNLAEVFEYMVGNTAFDFTAGDETCCQGAKVVAFTSREGTFLPVPYEFGMSGLVDAPEARPDSRAGIARVTDRAYRGMEMAPEVIEQTLARVREHQEEILALWANTPLLKERDRRESVRFLQEFFRELEKPDALAARLGESARSRAAIRAILRLKHKDAFEAWQQD